MKLTKIILGSLTATAALISLGSVPSQAAETNLSPASQKTTAKVGITAGAVTPGGGNLGVVQAPSFDFKSFALGNSNTVVTADGLVSKPVTEGTPLVEKDAAVVRDLRGTKEGWNLQISRTDFVDNAKTLTGATLTFVKETTTATNNGNPFALTGADVVVDGTPKVLANAAVGSGEGQTEITVKGATLKIPVAAEVGSYSSELTWTLADAPK